MAKTPQSRRVCHFTKAMQFRVELLDTTPLVWRRILVPNNYSFWDLHCAITDVMPWKDYHLHMFTVRKPGKRKDEQIGIPDEDACVGDPPIHPGWRRLIKDYFIKDGQRAAYAYDFGDDWIHGVLFEGLVVVEPGVSYPVCLDGKMAGPPEDCGGLDGFVNFKKAMQDPRHPEHEELKTWFGRPFDPNKFDAKAVRFLDPHMRYRVAMCGAKPPADWDEMWHER